MGYYPVLPCFSESDFCSSRTVKWKNKYTYIFSICAFGLEKYVRWAYSTCYNMFLPRFFMILFTDIILKDCSDMKIGLKHSCLCVFFLNCVPLGFFQRHFEGLLITSWFIGAGRSNGNVFHYIGFADAVSTESGISLLETESYLKLNNCELTIETLKALSVVYLALAAVTEKISKHTLVYYDLSWQPQREKPQIKDSKGLPLDLWDFLYCFLKKGCD